MRRVAWLAFAGALSGWAQTASLPGVRAEMVITVGHYYGADPRVLTKDNVTVTQHYEPLPVIDLIPLRGARAELEMFLLVDNCSSCEPGSKFEELRRFIASQPPTTAIGVAYIQDGRLQVAENPTRDHDRAVKALSAPTGSKPSSPFAPLVELIKNWASGPSQRVVLMISNGIDLAADEFFKSATAEAAIEEAQRAGVTVYAIYHPSADYLTADFSVLDSGQVQLAHLANETGGEAYLMGFGPLPSLSPFLADLSDHFANRYLLQFLAPPAEGGGALQNVTVKTKIANLDLMAPDRVWVPGRSAGSPKPELPTGKRP